MKPLYLDYAATTPLDPLVLQAMLTFLSAEGEFGNPASSHVYGQQARLAVEEAREQVASVIGAEASELIWTSGATEANNLAIKGAARLYQGRGRHIVTMKTEHKAVLDACQHLEKEGYRLTYLAPDANGLLDLALFKSALRDDTSLVSIMHVNNETGVVQDIAAIADITAERGILLHVDAAQSIGKAAINLAKMPIDLLSLSAHKVYGPKGIGALYLRKKPRVRVEPLIHGGGHEQGMRSGTLATHQIAGMGRAFILAQERFVKDYQHIAVLRDLFLKELQDIEALKLTVDQAHTVPHIINLCFDGMLAQAILDQLPQVAASTASACQGKGTEGSYVLRALGLSEMQARSAIRFSLGRLTTQQDIQNLARDIRHLF